MEDIFKSAFKETKGKTKGSAMQVVKKPRVKEEPVSKDANSNEVNSWDDLKLAMETTHAQRFHKILVALPPASFMPNYLKALEFFKPKVIRTDGRDGEVRDNKVTVHINKRTG